MRELVGTTGGTLHRTPCTGWLGRNARCAVRRLSRAGCGAGWDSFNPLDAGGGHRSSAIPLPGDL